METVKHPAVYSEKIMYVLKDEVKYHPDWLVLDPFAGTGRIHELPCLTIGVELEPEWAVQGNRNPKQGFELGPSLGTIIGNARMLPFRDGVFDAVITSPTYGNRMSDHHNAKDGSKRITYKHTLGRDLHSENTGQLQWGAQYKEFHIRVWREVLRVLRPSGYFMLNTSNHVRRGEVQRVTEWHRAVCREIGFDFRRDYMIATPRMKFGQNYELRVGHETLSIMTKPASLSPVSGPNGSGLVSAPPALTHQGDH